MEDKLNKGLLLTIAIPVYNTKPELLKRALLSIPDSKYIGVIVYDDGSTDYEYRTLIRDWLKNDPSFSFMNSDRFFFNRSNENKGLGAVRNTLIRKTGSDYIMFLDSDDEVMTDNFGEIIMYLLDNKVDVIYGNISLSIGDNVVEERWWDFVKTRLMIPYFTTCNFYNPKFLTNHNIFYSEGGATASMPARRMRAGASTTSSSPAASPTGSKRRRFTTRSSARTTARSSWSSTCNTYS